jgi:lipid II:glycine glycyltransferase (peptidoglycan interpeptide bridge formation enzyme)
VRVDVVTDPHATDALERLVALVHATEARSGVTGRGTDRIGIAWRAFASRGSAAIVEARVGDEVMASGMVVVVGDRSFYLFSGSLREAPGQPKAFPSYAMQWEMIRVARRLGAGVHDLWGIEPSGAGPEHRWHGIGTFKRSFGGRSVAWAGSWDLVLRPQVYALRSAVAVARELRGRLQRAA